MSSGQFCGLLILEKGCSKNGDIVVWNATDLIMWLGQKVAGLFFYRNLTQNIWWEAGEVVSG